MGWTRFFRRAKWDRERREELESYIRIATDENIERGMTARAAREAAQRKLGNNARIREEIYTMNTIAVLDSLVRDFRYALRAMRRRPTFTIAAVLTLALGIGANTAVFSVVNGVLIKPLPYPDSEQLVSLGHIAPGFNSENLAMSPTMYFTYRDENRTFQKVGLWSTGGQSVTGLGEPEQVRAAFVTYDMIQALGVQPMRGRWFFESDEALGAPDPDPVILTYGYWQRRFGGDNSAIGRSMTIDARPSQIVGVMPADFRFPNFDPEIILMQRFDRAKLTLGGFAIQGLARLKPGVTLVEASSDVERMLPIWLNAWPTLPNWGREIFAAWRITPALRPLKNDVVGNVGNMLWVVMATIGIVLVIACANIANLLLVRAEERRQEFAIRAALGAGRGRMAREIFVESFTLAAMGGAVGLALAYGGLALLAKIGPSNLPRLADISIDGPVLAFAAAASLISALLFGSIPALRNSAHIGSNLSGGTRGASTSRERHRMRNALVVVQVALALVLLISSGLMIRTFVALRNVHPGFTLPAEIQTARIWIPPNQIREAKRFTRMQHDILDKISAIPGVTAAGIASAVPLDGRSSGVDPIIAEEQTDSSQVPPNRKFKYISPGYFHAMGTQLVAGRDMTWTDIEKNIKVVVISENFARELWKEPAAAIGKRLREPSPGAGAPVWREVIGVVEDVHETGPHQKAASMVYWPIMMDEFYGSPTYGTRAIAYVVRSERAGTESLLSDVRQAVWAVNPNLPVFLVSTMKELYDRSLAQTSFALVMLAIAGVMALVLGLIGIYGVIAYTVSQRTREIGIRIALGAEQRQLKAVFVRHGLVLACIGMLIGLSAAAGVTRFMSSLLFEISPLDAMTYAAVLLVLLTAAALASYVPARRASSIDPVDAMRMD
jgi:putative ABC transport system permease protein